MDEISTQPKNIDQAEIRTERLVLQLCRILKAKNKLAVEGKCLSSKKEKRYKKLSRRLEDLWVDMPYASERRAMQKRIEEASNEIDKET